MQKTLLRDAATEAEDVTTTEEDCVQAQTLSRWNPMENLQRAVQAASRQSEKKKKKQGTIELIDWEVPIKSYLEHLSMLPFCYHLDKNMFLKCRCLSYIPCFDKATAFLFKFGKCAKAQQECIVKERINGRDARRFGYTYF